MEINRLYLKLFLLFSGVFIFFQPTIGQPRPNGLYVSPDGNDAANGTLAQPLATLQGAKEKVRALKAGGKLPSGEITVYFREGTYPFTETVAFGPGDAGTEKSPITYRNYEGETVNFSGGVTIPSEALQKVADRNVIQRLPASARDKVWRVDLKTMGITEYGQLYQHGFSLSIRPAPMELFVNGDPQTLARWPNEGTVEIGKVIDPGSNPRRNDFSQRGGIFQYDYDRAGRWHEADDIWLNGIFSNGYADDNLKVEKIDEKKHEIKVVQPHMYTIKSSADSSFRGGRIRGYYVYNLLEEIDQPGEYYIERNQGILYCYLPSSPEKSELVLSVMEEPFLALEDVSYVTFSGFNFTYGRGMGIYIEKGENNMISDCTFRNLGTLAIMMGKGAEHTHGPVPAFTGKSMPRQIGNFSAQYYQNQAWHREAGTRHLIKNCKFYQLGTGGVILDGGNRKTLTTGQNGVTHCEFYELNRWNKTYCPAIWLRGVGNRVAHNFMHDLPHAAILLSGNNLTIEYNEFTRVCQEFDDVGAIYTGRNPSERGNVIRYNYFHHIESEKNRVAAIYFDDGASGGRVIGNVFYRTGNEFGTVHISAGYDHLIENNIFVDCDKAFQNRPWNEKKWNQMVRGKLWKKRLLQDVDITKPPYITQYPELKGFFGQEERISRVVNNIIYRSGVVKSPHIEMVNNLITDRLPGFIDVKNEDFKLKNDALALKEIPGFKPIPFEKIGLQNELE